MSILPRPVCCLTLLIALSVSLPASPARAEEPFGAGSFRSACALAGKTRRIVLVDFYTTWCGPCKRLDETTWKDKTVRAWLTQSAVSRKIDAEKQTVLAAKYKIGAYPTILLLKPDGTEIDRLVGFREPKMFLTEVKQALAGQDSLARARARLNARGKEDPMARMDYADALTQKGRHADALKEYLWCLDEGNKHNIGFTGVRLSFLLNDIVRLGEEYPPATAALKQRRDVARAALENGSANPDAAEDFGAYNRELGEQAETLAVYDRLRARNVSAAALFRHISDQLLERKRYADLIQGAGNLSAQVDMEVAFYKMISGNAQFDKETKDILMRAAVKKGGGFYEALLGTDRTAEAEALRDKLLAFDPSAVTYAELIRHAVRAGKLEAAQQLKQSARTALSAAAFAQLEKAAP
jgi:thiol-disulfide isomerase/thioredoxin